METRSFDKIWVRYQEMIKNRTDYLKGCKSKPELRSKLQNSHIERLYNAIKHYEKKMLKFGEGSVIRIVGTQQVYNKITNLWVDKPFETTFTGITIDNAKEYIETLVKLNLLKVNTSTISYYIIKTGINLLTKPNISYVK